MTKIAHMTNSAFEDRFAMPDGTYIERKFRYSRFGAMVTRTSQPSEGFRP